MKALPEYLEKILDHMAVCEEKNGGLKKEEAYELYKKELYNESLTAKANPSPKAELNPVKESSKKTVQAHVDSLISLGLSPAEIVQDMKKYNYHASIKAVEKYMKKNPRLSEGKSFMDFDQTQLAAGTQVEMEHTDNVQEAQRIAMDHLSEDKDYYKKLKLMEAGALDAAINPTIKAFHEIYTAAGERFANSYLGKKLGYRFRPGKEALEKVRDDMGKLLPVPQKYHSSKQKAGIDRKLKLEKVYGKKDGKEQWFDKKHYEPVDPALLNSDGYKFFETLRNFSNNTGEAILRCFYGEKTKRPLKTLNKGWANHASGEYYKNEMLTKGEIRDDAERSRYMQLMVSSIVFATIEPLFDLTPAKLDKLLDTMMKKYPANKWNDTKTRQAFVKDVLDYVKNKGQL